MIENFNLLLICGGKNVCDSSWNKAADAIDQCFKVYFPVKGEAALVMNGQEKRLVSGHVYFISGFDIELQRRDNSMEVYWVHFMPKSLELLHLLRSMEPFHQWPGKVNWLGNRGLEQIEMLFAGPRMLKDESQPWRLFAARCKVEALLLHLLSGLMENAGKKPNGSLKEVPERLRSAIDYMNNNFLRMPPLQEVAAQSFLAPNYFHRLFAQTFGVTPMQYMTQRRLDLARELLATKAMTIKEVAFRVGFKNEFHFSRVFKTNIGIAPREFKQQNWQA